MFLQHNSFKNRNIDEARAIFGEDFNFDGIDYNELNEVEEDEDDEIDEEEDEEIEDVEPKYDEDGNLVEDVNEQRIKKRLESLFRSFRKQPRKNHANVKFNVENKKQKIYSNRKIYNVVI